MKFCKVFEYDDKQFLFWLEDLGGYFWCFHQIFYITPDKQIDMKIESDNGKQLWQALQNTRLEHCENLEKYVESIYGSGDNNVH